MRSLLAGLVGAAVGLAMAAGAALYVPDQAPGPQDYVRTTTGGTFSAEAYRTRLERLDRAELCGTHLPFARGVLRRYELLGLTVPVYDQRAVATMEEVCR